MLVSAQLDYALRALIALAQVPDRPVKRQDLARAQNIPTRYLENVLVKLCHGGLLASNRGHDGGYRLVKPATEITVGEVAVLLDGSLVHVNGSRLEHLTPSEGAVDLRPFWLGMSDHLQGFLAATTVADLIVTLT